MFGVAKGLRQMELCVEDTIEYTAQRTVFGKPVLANQVVYHKLAEIQSELEALRALLYRAAGEHMAGKDVIPAAEMVQKVKAACDARRDADFVIMARTDAAGVSGVDDAIERLNLYAEAGADALYADALLSAEDIARVAGSVPRPYVCNMGFGLQPRSTTPVTSSRRGPSAA